jgi:hypothetical protein
VLVTAALRVNSSSVLLGIAGAGAFSPSIVGAINLTISGIVFTAVLVGGMLIARPVEDGDVVLLAQFNPRLRPILAPFAHRAESSPLGGPNP